MKFIIVASPRTGSTLLSLSLNAHPNIICLNEPLHLSPDLRKEAVKGTKLTPYDGDFDAWMNQFMESEVNGFKQIYFKHKTQVEPLKIIEFLENHKGVKVIHLIRPNILASYTSLMMAQKTGIWRSDDEPNDIPRWVRLNPQEAEKYFKYTEYFIEKIRKLNNTTLEVKYQEKDMLKKCFDFLGVVNFNIKEPLKKLSDKPLFEQIKNYTELVNYFKNTKYSSFFESKKFL